MECYRTYDFFPPGFLHVLLLRLAFTFALPKTPSELDDEAAIVDVYSRKCTLWKSGIRWCNIVDSNISFSNWEQMNYRQWLFIHKRYIPEFPGFLSC